jgi:hypothetical protein
MGCWAAASAKRSSVARAMPNRSAPALETPNAERRTQQRRLLVRQLGQPAKQRPDQLVQASEGKAGFIAHALGRQHPHPRGRARTLGEREQRRLADTGRPAQHHRSTL